MIQPALKNRSIAVLASLLVATGLWGDALVVTRAMKASTIAEIFVEEDAIRVEIEVGSDDIDAFWNLLPDELFQKVTGESRPLKGRLNVILRDDWKILTDDQQLVGTTESIELAKRIIRDEITGEPLPNQPEDAEIVLRAQFRYALETKPESISIYPPTSQNNFAQANIGFVAYHNGVAVNDFRYLSREETLRLDWSDPWYSAFERKTLRRRYFAPAAAFLYVENFEVRKEIVFRPKDLQEWVDLGLEGKSTIEASERERVCETAAAYLSEHTPVEIDGESPLGALDRVHFIERSLRTAGVVEPEQDIDINRAVIGAIYVYPRTSLPQKVKLQWDLFNDRITQVPTVATDEAGGMPGTLSPGDPVLVWQNFLKHPTIPAFLEVTPSLRRKALSCSFITIACLVMVAWIWVKRRDHDPAPQPVFTPIVVTVCLIGIAIGTHYWPSFQMRIPLEKQRAISDSEGGAIAHSLLHNIYRAFDYRDQSTIYDVLDRSASGDLLTRVFLETRQSLTLASQGGARVKVKGVELVSCEVEPVQSDAFAATCTWTVTGSVGHWGHIHQRTNQYDGEFTVQVIDGQWKFTEMELLSEERL
jgi:hypothetical protein